MSHLRPVFPFVLGALTLSACVADSQESRDAEIFWGSSRDACDPTVEAPDATWWTPFPITCVPKDDSLWDIVPIVQRFESEAPAWAIDAIGAASREQLLGDVSVSFVQDVADAAGVEQRHAAVEITSGLVEVPYETFVGVLPAEDWGVELSSRIGGEVIVYEVDSEYRATRQLERMVLSPFSIPIWTGLADNDMTKVEVIQYGQDGAKVYWRVIYSDNNSTEMDVGSVEFRRFDSSSTLITFHSAHRLNAVGAVHIDSGLVAPVLETTFRALIDHYRALATTFAP